MSDDGSMYDDDDWLDIDDFPYNEAEDLATHTIPSPPFIDYDSDNEKLHSSSEWEYDHDDYWDHDSPMQRKRNNAREDTNEINDGPKRKRRRVDFNDIPGPSLDSHKTTAPTVIWRSKYDQLRPHDGPIFRTGQGEKVALLKDWKERFKSHPNLTAPQPESKHANRRGSQIATAVLIEEHPLETNKNNNNTTTLRPATLKTAARLPSRSKASPLPALNNGTPTYSKLISSERSTSNKLVGNTTIARQKRTMSDLPNHEENELPAPQKRLRTPKKNNSHTPKQPLTNRTQRKAHDSDHHPSIASPPPLANRTNGSVPASRKRKADDSDDAGITSPRKRTDTRGVEEGSAFEADHCPIRRATRRKR